MLFLLFVADKNVTNFGSLTTYKNQEQRYHLMGALLPQPKESHKFLQVYFMGGNQAEAQQRSTNVHGGLELNSHAVTGNNSPTPVSDFYICARTHKVDEKKIIQEDKHTAAEHAKK